MGVGSIIEFSIRKQVVNTYVMDRMPATRNNGTRVGWLPLPKQMRVCALYRIHTLLCGPAVENDNRGEVESSAYRLSTTRNASILNQPKETPFGIEKTQPINSEVSGNSLIHSFLSNNRQFPPITASIIP